nr:MAG TPA: hypothetical protein [Caudoviricetes sp.]
MKENSIEETKKQLELILKVRKEQKEIIECAGGSCMNCDPDIKALSKSIEILLDYKRVLNDNEELRKKLNEENKRCMMLAVEKQDYFEKYKYHLQQNESLTNEFINYIPKQKVKNKIEEVKEFSENAISSVGLQLTIEVLQELLESEK